MLLNNYGSRMAYLRTYRPCSLRLDISRVFRNWMALDWMKKIHACWWCPVIVPWVGLLYLQRSVQGGLADLWPPLH